MGGQLVVSAHLDDAVLSAYAVLGPDTTVVTVLAGLPPDGVVGAWDAGSGADDSRSRVAERRAEDLRALALTGAAHVHLDFLDRQYVGRGGARAPAEADVSDALRPLLLDAEEVYAPSALSARTLRSRLRPSGHSDHRLVRDAALAVRPDAILYADLPYARHPRSGGFRLPREVRGRGLRRHVVRLGAATIAEKLRAVECYATQLAPLARAFGDFVSEPTLGTEAYWAPPGLPTIAATRAT